MELNGTEQDEAKTEVEGKTGNIDAAQGRLDLAKFSGRRNAGLRAPLKVPGRAWSNGLWAQWRPPPSARFAPARAMALSGESRREVDQARSLPVKTIGVAFEDCLC